MNNGNNYEYRKRQDNRVNRQPGLSDVYSASSNYNIFPPSGSGSGGVPYDNNNTSPYRDPRHPMTIQSANQLNFASIDSNSTLLKENYHTTTSQTPLSPSSRTPKNIDPLVQMAQTFNQFAITPKENPSFRNTIDNDPTIPRSRQPTNPTQRTIERYESNAAVDTSENCEDERRDDRVTLEKNILGDQRMASYAYPAVYKDRPFLQVPQMNLVINPKPLYLHVESTERNRERYPNPAEYVFPLVSESGDVDTPGERYKNVYEISLLSATVPNSSAVFDYPYLILQIDEIGGHYHSVGPGCKKAFTKLFFENPGGKFLRVDKGIGDPAVRVFYPTVLASLSKLSISIRKPDGTLFNFGTDTVSPQDPNPDIQNTFTFQIYTKIVDVEDALGHRNP